MDELFVVVELQRNGDQISNIVTYHNTLQEAQHKFHTVAAYAAISNVPLHTVLLFEDDLMLMYEAVFDKR